MPLQRKRSWMNWDGCEPVAAWQPLYAPSHKDSLWNWQDKFATSGAEPAFSPATGWTFNGVDQYLATGITPTSASWSAMVRFANVSGSGTRAVFGHYTGGAAGAFLLQITNTAMDMYNGADYPSGYLTVSGAMTAGVYAIAGKQPYRNGVAEASTIPAGTTTGAEIWIAGLFGYGQYLPADIQAFALWNTTLATAQMWQRAQMLAHLESADWNVWSPARRWFFVPPSVPAVATPVLSTIYINTADVGDTSLFDSVSGAAVSASYARTGTNSFALDGSDYLQADLTSSATKYSKFGLLVTATPAADALLCAWQEDGTEHVSLYLTDKLTLQMRQGSTIIQTSPTTLETETWYCVETKIVVHTTTGRFQVRIDGVDDMSAIGINTDADVDGAINEIRFEAPVDDTYIDDIVVREDQWCGTGGVYVISPTAAGTVEEWTGDYADVDDLPPSFTDYISTIPGSASDHLFRHGGLAGDYDISVVGVFAKGRLGSAADELFYALARSNATDDTGDAQDLDTTGVYARLLMTTNPDGSVAWTTHAVNNALQIGVEA